jgi:hypothetical protein
MLCIGDNTDCGQETERKLRISIIYDEDEVIIEWPTGENPDSQGAKPTAQLGQWVNRMADEDAQVPPHIGAGRSLLRERRRAETFRESAETVEPV